MPRRSDLKEQVLSRLQGEQMIRFVEGLGINLRRSGGEYKCVCPFHDDHSPSMGVNVRKSPNGIFKCFSCDWSGDIFKFVGDLRGISSFVDQMKWIAQQLGIPVDGHAVREGAAPAKRNVERKTPAVETMDPLEVLNAYKAYKKAAIQPDEYCQKLGVDPRALKMIGAVIAPYATSPDRIVLVVPQRNYDGNLISLRFRCFATKKRWSLDVKQRIDGEWVQVKCSQAGIMAMPEFFDASICIDYVKTIVVEGETDLLAGITMMLQAYGEDYVEWPARWAGLPGATSCHDMLVQCPLTPVVMTFLDLDSAGHTAVFNHRPMKVVIDADGNKTRVKDLDRPYVAGLLMKLNAAGRQARAAFPPRKPGQKKYDLRDMVRDGWNWRRFYAYCVDHGTADVMGRGLKEVVLES